MNDQVTERTDELSPDDLERVVGGIIIVGGFQKVFGSGFERVALNPQPLPPKYASLAGLFGH